MKKSFKKASAYAIISLIIIVTVAVSVIAASFTYDLNNDNMINDEDVKLVMNSVVDKPQNSLTDKNLADYDGNGDLNVLDVIALQKIVLVQTSINDGWTIGIY